MTSSATVGAAQAAVSRRLATAGVEAPRLDARLLIAHALGVEPLAVLARPERSLTAGERDRLEALVAARAARRPMAQILGEREFWSLPFKVTPATLTPRPDSETLIEAALDWAGPRDRPLSVLDLGTGSGCLLLALLSEWPRAQGVGVDIDPAAVAVARENAERLGLRARARFALGDWGNGLAERFDLVISNPPYIPEDEIHGLAPEVAAFEPRRALSGGADGLAAYRAIIGQLSGLLRPEGAAILELGAGQATAVAALVRAAGLARPILRHDLAGVPRALLTSLFSPAVPEEETKKKGWNTRRR